MSRNYQLHCILFAAILSAALVVIIDALTNSLDIRSNSWDFRYYISMAQDGPRGQWVSPFAYRYVTPFLVYGLDRAFNMTIEQGFRSVAYAGGFLQLFGIFLFVNWFAKSFKGALLALLVTAFSMFNLKYLLFDIYRPDHLSYVLILLQTHFAFQRKFTPLLLVTLIASQIREFNLLPLAAYLIAFAPTKDRPMFLKESVVGTIGLALAIGLPRLLIPVQGDFQFASLSSDGLQRILIAPLILPRDINFLFSILAYLLPSLILLNTRRLKTFTNSLSRETKTFLAAYTVFVLILTMYGGTDFVRFATYLFLLQIIFIGLAADTISTAEFGMAAAITFLFNRIWMNFPEENLWDIYAGFSTRVNRVTLFRFLEIIGWASISVLIRKFIKPGSSLTSASTS